MNANAIPDSPSSLGSERDQTGVPSPETTIVIRAFNEERWLPEVLAAIERQAYRDFEVLLVDSGSLDRTREIAAAHGARIIRLRNEDIDTGWLSPGVVRCAETMKGTMALSYRPPARATILLDGRRGKTQELVLPLPGLVMIGLESKYYLWAVKGTDFHPAAPLFNAPLPNINTDASICFGSNKLPRATGQSMAKVWELFWASPFSDHAVQGKSLANLKDIRPAIRALAGGKRA